MWECGLKLCPCPMIFKNYPVTPHVGVWIETLFPQREAGLKRVTPHVGVWIETRRSMAMRRRHSSHSPCGSVD